VGAGRVSGAHDNGGLDRSFIAALVREHREIEAGLDRLSEALRSGEPKIDPVRELAELIERHYLNEERFLAALEAHDPKLAAKLRAQHDEASEIGERLLESLAVGDSAEALHLSRRFLAIAQHNIIEEERDVFPLAQRISASGQERG
jgi:hypothetical protein